MPSPPRATVVFLAVDMGERGIACLNDFVTVEFSRRSLASQLFHSTGAELLETQPLG